MAIITFDNDNGVVSILLEKTDLMRIKEGKTTCSQSVSNRSAGEVLINDEVKLCVVCGERR